MQCEGRSTRTVASRIKKKESRSDLSGYDARGGETLADCDVVKITFLERKNFETLKRVLYVRPSKFEAPALMTKGAEALQIPSLLETLFLEYKQGAAGDDIQWSNSRVDMQQNVSRLLEFEAFEEETLHSDAKVADRMSATILGSPGETNGVGSQRSWGSPGLKFRIKKGALKPSSDRCFPSHILTSRSDPGYVAFCFFPLSRFLMCRPPPLLFLYSAQQRQRKFWSVAL